MAVHSYADFCQEALYGPQGYYRQAKTRVGRSAEADFYTASSVPLFARLLAAAFTTLAQLHRLEKAHVAELGNEPGAGLFQGIPRGFESATCYPLGSPFQIQSPAIVFSNELFDAQPFERVRYEKGSWQQLGLEPEEKILDVQLGPASDELQKLLGTHFAEGSTLDVSPQAYALVDEICAGGWKGVFVAFDYGLTLPELVENPRPTARAYQNHRLLGLDEALALPPGSYDITHHVVWDFLAEKLRQNGFHVHPVATQEAFFVNYAAAAFPTLDENERKQLATLLHPAHMGAKFQVLIASR